ncbi:MAG: SDR family NAD(P)-dependent oxidoreductase [Cellulomonas sp.]|nr:SDR family NAD(P)-dependent oxidoreductase [Cellulomonas sp.]
MTARTVVLTGASDGIGAAAARALTAAGDHVVVVGRSPAKTAALAAELGTEHLVADFARLDEVRGLAEALLSAYPQVDVLANNAGAIFGATRTLTADGFESTFQVNYLAPFLLTELLHDRLVASRATVINTSSVAGARFGRLDLDDLQSSQGYSATRAYGSSKLAQILHAKELDRRYGADGLAAASFHPGGIASNFSTTEGSPWRFLYSSRLKNLVLNSTDKGADTLVWLAQTPPHEGWEPGGYYVKRRPGRVVSAADDAGLAAGLWERSVGLLGLG